MVPRFSYGCGEISSLGIEYFYIIVNILEREPSNSLSLHSKAKKYSVGMHKTLPMSFPAYARIQILREKCGRVWIPDQVGNDNARYEI